jgi:hypothetical protein
VEDLEEDFAAAGLGCEQIVVRRSSQSDLCPPLSVRAWSRSREFDICIITNRVDNGSKFYVIRFKD